MRMSVEEIEVAMEKDIIRVVGGAHVIAEKQPSIPPVDATPKQSGSQRRPRSGTAAGDRGVGSSQHRDRTSEANS